MVSGSKYNSGEHENVVDQLVNLYPRWPRVKTSSSWDSCCMMIQVGFTASTCYIRNYSLINITWEFFGSHLSNEEQQKHLTLANYEGNWNDHWQSCTHAPILHRKVIGSAVRASNDLPKLRRNSTWSWRKRNNSWKDHFDRDFLIFFSLVSLHYYGFRSTVPTGTQAQVRASDHLNFLIVPNFNPKLCQDWRDFFVYFLNFNLVEFLPFHDIALKLI